MGLQNPFERLNFLHVKCYMSGIQSSGNCVPNSQILTRAAVGNCSWENGHTFYYATCYQIVLGGNGKWEMQLGLLVGNATPYPLSTGNCRGPKCQLEIHQSNTPQMEREGCRVLCVFTAKLTEFIFSLSRHNWETGNGKLDRGRFRCEAEKARPEKPERSTEGQAGLRARRWAWPSVPIGLAPKIRVVRVDLSSQAQVQRTAARRGDRLTTNSPCRSTMCPGRRSVQPDHRRTPKAAVPWGGSFCFPLMAPRMTPECDVTAILVASHVTQQVGVQVLRNLRICLFLKY